MKRQDREDLDPLLAAALSELREETQYNVDWSKLRSSINNRAELPLARRRSAPRRTFLTRSLRTVAIAASLAFALWMGPGVYQEIFQAEPAGQFVANVDDDMLVEAVTGDFSEQELLQLVNGSPEVLLAVAIGPP